jgi:sulfite exporter TauE/SafE
MSDDANTKLLLTLLIEQSNELRYRAQAEATYTAATVATFGATAWGVAAVANLKGNSIAILLAVFGIVALAGAVCWRIWTDHTKFANAKKRVRHFAGKQKHGRRTIRT